MLLFEVTKPRLFDGFNFFLLTWEIWFINNFLNSTYCLVYITPISMYQAFVLRVPLESKEILKWCALFSPWYSIHYKQNTIFLKAIFFLLFPCGKCSAFKTTKNLLSSEFACIPYQILWKPDMEKSFIRHPLYLTLILHFLLTTELFYQNQWIGLLWITYKGISAIDFLLN